MSNRRRIRRDSSRSRLEQENEVLRRELLAAQAEVANKNHQLDRNGFALKKLNERVLAEEKDQLTDRLDWEYLQNRLVAAEKKKKKMFETITNQYNRVRNLELKLAIRKDEPFVFENKHEQRLEQSLEHTKKEQGWLEEKQRLLEELKAAHKEVNAAKLQCTRKPIAFLCRLYFLLCIMWPLFFILNV